MTDDPERTVVRPEAMPAWRYRAIAGVLAAGAAIGLGGCQSFGVEQRTATQLSAHDKLADDRLRLAGNYSCKLLQARGRWQQPDRVAFDAQVHKGQTTEQTYVRGGQHVIFIGASSVRQLRSLMPRAWAQPDNVGQHSAPIRGDHRVDRYVTINLPPHAADGIDKIYLTSEAHSPDGRHKVNHTIVAVGCRGGDIQRTDGSWGQVQQQAQTASETYTLDYVTRH